MYFVTKSGIGGEYYEGDRQSIEHIETPTQRPSPLHYWTGEEWSRNDELAKADVKTKAQAILVASDWVGLEDVTTLTNKSEWADYRAKVRAIRLNPTPDAIFPSEPAKVWASQA